MSVAKMKFQTYFQKLDGNFLFLFFVDEFSEWYKILEKKNKLLDIVIRKEILP